MLILSNGNNSVIQGLIAPKGLDCLKALISWKFQNQPEGGGGGEGGEEEEETPQKKQKKKK